MLPTMGHDIADIDPRIRAQRHFAAHPRQRAQEHATRIAADAFGHVLDGAAVELAIVDQQLDHVAGNRFEDLIGVDLGADDCPGGNHGCSAPGDDDVVARLKQGIQMGFDIDPLANDALDDSAAADVLLDRPDGAARCG
ncbi:uncharacterized protein (UPF0212 family) [Bradyrhizobium sp. LB7.2]